MDGQEIQINTAMPLEYLFEAVYKDGEVYRQTVDDSSLFVSGKNAFFDIYYQPFKPLDELVEFALVGKGHRFAVNLKTGMFSADGLEFQVGNDLPLNFNQCKFRLIFFLRKNHHYNVAMEEKGREIKHYRIGWQTTIQFKNPTTGEMQEQNFEQMICVK